MINRVHSFGQAEVLKVHVTRLALNYAAIFEQTTNAEKPRQKSQSPH